MIYCVCFLLSSLLFYLSEKQPKSRVSFSVIALFIPCFLAGIRADTVGTDVSVYLEPMVENVRNALNFRDYMLSSWQQGWVVRGVADIEIGFSFLVYFIIKLFNSIYVLQFVVQLLTIWPIYFGLREKNEKNLWLGMLVYFCMFYNNSLNIMRQSISIAFVFLAFQYLFNEKRKEFIIFLVVACLFHNSAVLGFLIWFIYEFIRMRIFKKRRTLKTANTRLVVLTCAGLAVLFAQNLISSIMAMVGLSDYVHYIMGELTFLPNQLIIRLPILILCYFLRKRLYAKEGDQYLFYVCCVIYTIIFSQFASVNSFAYRIAMVFSIFQIEFIPCIASVPSRIRLGSARTFKLNRLIMVLYLFVWWVYYSLIMTDSTLPYVTRLFSDHL